MRLQCEGFRKAGIQVYRHFKSLWLRRRTPPPDDKQIIARK
jgi:hypothetical protein